MPEINKDVFAFALQLKAGRAIVGWSQAELAERSGVARPTVARIEALMMQPRLDTVGKLKQAFLDAGLQILDGEPAGGFSLMVNGTALHGLMDAKSTPSSPEND